MDMDRRNFFGIIAAPLLRHVGPPPVPMGGFVQLGQVAMLHSGEAVISPQMAARLGRAAGEHWRRKIATLLDPGEITFHCTFTPNAEL